MSYILHCTKKLIDRIKAPLAPLDSAPTSTCLLGTWYATALFWKPQLALFVHEETLLPVLMPLAPASSLTERFPAHLAEVLHALKIDARFITTEIAAMGQVQYAKTSSRSVLGTHESIQLLGRGLSGAPGDFRSDRTVFEVGACAVQPSIQARNVSR